MSTDKSVDRQYRVVPTADALEARPVRNKHAWAVLFASFLTQFLGPGLNYASGVLHVALLEKYDDDVTLTAWIGSLHSSMFALAGPIACVTLNTFDCRTCVFLSGVLGLAGYGASVFVTNIRFLFITYAFLAGLSHAFAQLASVVVIGFYFPHDTSMATGICVSGTALGAFVHPPLVQTMIDSYGLPGAFLIVGAIVSHCCAFGLVMRPCKSELTRKELLRSGRTSNEAVIHSFLGDCFRERSIFLNIRFVLFSSSVLLLAMGYAVHILFLPVYFTNHGAAILEATWSISAIGIGSLLSRIFIGLMANDEKIGSELAYCGVVGISFGVTLLLPVMARSTVGRLFYGLLFGLYTGGVFSLLSDIAIHIAGTRRFAVAMGAIMFFFGLGYFIGPPIADGMHNATDNYEYVFISSSVMLFGALSCGVLSTLQKRPTYDTVTPTLDHVDETANTENTQEQLMSVAQKS